ncbi:MAG: hypothetical protein DWQ01_12245 [Planctomycetota bacterium]|nr:MAG: hypothetical protein DWQ01_12245 [Planctomycetota bacterium]
MSFLALLVAAPLVALPQEEWHESPVEAQLQQTFSSWSIQILNLPEEDLRLPFAASLTLPDLSVDLLLEPYSVRSKDFRLLVQGEDGVVREEAPPPPHTYRGEVAALEGSRVAASLFQGQLDALVDLGGDRGLWFVQPLSDFVDGAAPDEHVLYRSDWVLADGDARCGVPDPPAHSEEEHRGSGTQAGSSDVTAELAIDCDNRYYTANGGTNGTMNEVEALVNALETIYQRDCGICYELNRTVLRSSSTSDPYYNNPDPGFLLDTLRSEWLGPFNSEPRDMAHLLSGHPNTTGVVGLAYVAVTCNKSWHYGISLRYSDLYTQTGLVAHELGHNWSAGHCSGSGCYIMCGGLGGCGGDLSKFAQVSIDTINNYKNNANCLDGGCGLPPGPLTLGLPSPGDAGVWNFITVEECTPGETQYLYASAQWPGSGSVPGCPNLTFEFDSPKLVATGASGAQGTFTFTGFVPAGLSGRLLAMQAVEPATCRISNIVLDWF